MHRQRMPAICDAILKKCNIIKQPGQLFMLEIIIKLIEWISCIVSCSFSLFVISCEYYFCKISKLLVSVPDTLHWIDGDIVLCSTAFDENGNPFAAIFKNKCCVCCCGIAIGKYFDACSVHINVQIDVSISVSGHILLDVWCESGSKFITVTPKIFQQDITQSSSDIC